MSSRNYVEVIIDGKIYTLSGYESDAYLQKVASYINGKITEFKKDEVFRRQNRDVQRTLLEINIADDYFKAKKQADMLETDVEDKDKQLYDLKHELITLQVKNETLSKENTELNKKIIDYEKQIIKFETQLGKSADELSGKESDSGKKVENEVEENSRKSPDEASKKTTSRKNK